MIEVHFNWIFILIVGAIIFIFFVNIVNKQREFSEIKSSGTIITSLESILTGAQISTNTINIMDMPKVDIGFECNRYFIGPIPKPTKSNVIFSPGLLKGKKLITWALDWNVPYRVTNFLYITDPQLRYVIVYDEDTETVANSVYDELPEEINKEIPMHKDDLTALKDKNNYKVKFIFLIDEAPNFPAELDYMEDKDVTAINLGASSSNIISSTGTIEFFQKKGSNWESKGTTCYLKEESLFGAIFAEDIDMYNCVMKKAFKKLNLVTEIYLDRSDELERYYFSIDKSCYQPYSSAKTQLNYMKIASENRIDDFPQGIGHMDTMNDYALNLKEENQRAQLFSCALIY